MFALTNAALRRIGRASPPLSVTSSVVNPDMPSKLVCWTRQSAKSWWLTPRNLPPRAGLVRKIRRSRSGCSTGKSRNTPLTMVNMMVGIPVPSVSPKMAMAAIPGDLRSIRTAKRIS